MIGIIAKTHIGNNRWIVEYCVAGEVVTFTKVVQL